MTMICKKAQKWCKGCHHEHKHESGMYCERPCGPFGQSCCKVEGKEKKNGKK